MREKWQEELARAYSSAAELHAAHAMGDVVPATTARVAAAFQVRVTRYYAGLMDPDPARPCPIRAQALPHGDELDGALPAWARAWSRRCYGRDDVHSADAIGDVALAAAPRLTHRYRGRAILHASPSCAVYCRFCFRKAHMQAGEAALYGGRLDATLAYVRAHPELREVILTGGDPLSLPDAALARLLDQLAAIPHVRHVRIHSRMAVTLPCRLTRGLAAALGGRRLVTALVSHFNHPRELTPTALRHLARLRRRGVPLYNQSVLLRGVNDRAATLGRLWQRLFEAGVRPFYLHHPDYTPGTFHFRVSLARGLRLMAALAGRLSGPALPAYVLDLPGGGGKVRLAPGSLTALRRRAGGGVRGVLYRVSPPATQAEMATAVLYPDLHPVAGNAVR